MSIIPSSSVLAVTYQDITELKAHPQNSRAHTRQQIKLVARSIETYGWTNPILIDDDDNVIAGHARLEAAKSLSMEQVPTICLSHMTPAQKRAYIIADNRMNEIAGSWDRNILALEHQAIRLIDPAFDLSSTGFSLDAAGNVAFGWKADTSSWLFGTCGRGQRRLSGQSMFFGKRACVHRHRSRPGFLRRRDLS